MEKCARRRERLNGKFWIGRWRTVGPRCDWRCWICCEPVDPSLRVPHPLAPTTDHVIPLVLGGSDDEGNVRLAHFSCNTRRGCQLREGMALDASTAQQIIPVAR